LVFVSNFACLREAASAKAGASDLHLKKGGQKDDGKIDQWQ
jgi:hypothetical protein